MGRRARTRADLEIPRFDDIQDLTEEERAAIGRDLFEVTVCSQRPTGGRLKNPKEMQRWLREYERVVRRKMH